MVDAKTYLKQIRLYDAHINTKLEERQHLREKLTSITPTLKDDVVSGGGSQDKLGDAVAKLVDLEDEINQAIDNYVELKKEVNRLIDKIPEPDQLYVIHKRYAEYKSWETIASEMGYTYRWVCAIHGKALLAVENLLKKAKTS